MRTDFFDFPTAWAIQNEGSLKHHPLCSQPSMLCDCGAVVAEWKRRCTTPDNVECPSCDGEGFLTAPYPDGETRRSECFDCEGTGITPENVDSPT